MSMPRPNQNPGPLADHVRKGRVFSPPLAATGALTIGDWVHNDLPDLLWPILVIGDRGPSGVRSFVQWQGDVVRDLAGTIDDVALASGLNGRLTALARLGDEHEDRQQRLVKAAKTHGLLSAEVEHALACYPYRPAGWLTSVEIHTPDQAEVDLVARSILTVLTDAHLEALLKCLPVWAAVQAGVGHYDPVTIDLLKDYPVNEAKRSQADSVVRAAWGASKAADEFQDPAFYEEALRWARVFWGANSMTTKCVRGGRDAPDDGAGASQADGSDIGQETSPTRGQSIEDGVPPIAEMPAEGAHLRRRVLDLLSSYMEAIETSPRRLDDPAPLEVHTGLVSRAGRDLAAALGHADLWCLEHGAHIGRMLVEIRIYLAWMSGQDPAIYRQFQDYGAGKAKLYSRMIQESGLDLEHPGAREGAAEFDRLSHTHDVLDHRVVDTRDSFAEGKSLRAMADECGLLDLYRYAYTVSSGVTHSEWWSVETHAMEPCRNVLHGGHRIPSLSLNPGGNVPLAEGWVDQFYTLLWFSLESLRADPEATEAAFAWLHDDDTTI